MNQDIELFKAGLLSEAINELSAFVKLNATDIDARSRLVEYYCVATDYERAERQLEIIASIDPRTSMRVVELRQLLRAAVARADLWKNGRAPRVLGQLPDYVQSRLRAIISKREGDYSDAEKWLIRATQDRPEFELLIDDEIVPNFRDLDDFVADILEVFTSSGKYIWIPFQEISEAIFSPIKRPIDTAFLPVELTLTDGMSGIVYVPCIYHAVSETPSDCYLMGRETDWHQQQAIFQGIGLRCFLKNNESISISQIKSIRSVK